MPFYPGGDHRESVTELRLALDASGVVGTWDWDCVRGTARYDRGAAALLAGDAELAGQILRSDVAMAGIHPEDRRWLEAEVRRAIAAGGHFLAEYRVVTAERGIRWLFSRGRVFQDEYGRPVRCRGILIDITDSREAGGGYIAGTGGGNRPPLDRLAAALLDARRAIDEVEALEGATHLRLVLDLALFEVGNRLARDPAP